VGLISGKLEETVTGSRQPAEKIEVFKMFTLVINLVCKEDK
jgi:hypothetical protein